MEIQCLERGKQWEYRACPPKPWRRLVRAVRAGMVGPWSDQATRVANI